jgi:hypothetical protein
MDCMDTETEWVKSNLVDNLWTKDFETDIYCIFEIETEEFGKTYSVHILDIWDEHDSFKVINREVYSSLEEAKEAAETHYKSF